MKSLFPRILVLFACIFLVPELSHAVEKWHNPEGSGARVVHGQAFFSKITSGGGNFYHRLPETANGKVRKSVWKRSLCSSGLSLVFSTDADKITVRYQVSRPHAMPNMSATGVSGVDLYTHDRNGREIYLAGKYQFRDTITFTYNPIYIEKKPKLHRYTLYLPLYNEVKWLEVGVDDGADFRFEPVLPARPIVAYGTSICQGASASRPAMAWTVCFSVDRNMKPSLR